MKKRRANVDQPQWREPAVQKSDTDQAIICPVCGAVGVREKCKLICRSEKCRGRVIMNCSEF